MKSEREVWRGENGEGLDEDIGYGFILGEVGIELISVEQRNNVSVSAQLLRRTQLTKRMICLSDRANNKLQEQEGFILHAHQVIGNVKINDHHV